MAGHDDELELILPVDRCEIAKHPLDVSPPARLRQHAGCRIEPAQPSRVTELPCLVQHRAGSAADIEHGLRRHDERHVEIEVGPLLARTQPVIEGGKAGIGEQAIDHARMSGIALRTLQRRRRDLAGCLLPWFAAATEQIAQTGLDHLTSPFHRAKLLGCQTNSRDDRATDNCTVPVRQSLPCPRWIAASRSWKRWPTMSSAPH